MKAVLALAPLLLLSACSPSNNLLEGRIQETVGTHTIVVTDCYRVQAPRPQRLSNGDYHYTPCRDAEIWIHGDDLTVNGTPYGHLAPGDGILVDHGVVSIQRKAPRS